MKYLTVLITIFICLGCSSQPKENIKEGQKESNSNSTVNDSLKHSPLLVFTHSGSAHPGKQIKLNGFKFTVAFKNTDDTIYWSTIDTNFRTPENHKIGMEWNQLSQELKDKLSSTLGWGYSIKLKSGWYLGFCEGSYCTDSLPKNDSKVKRIFKHKE